MATRARRRRRGGFSEINLTPLVDVMLALLIVFMITAPLLTSSMAVDLPNVRAEAAPIQAARVVVSITASERVLLEDRDVTAVVEAAFARRDGLRDRVVYLRADENARYKVVARVVAAARAAGARSVHLVVEAVEA